MQNNDIAVILAAGDGTRMKVPTSKVMLKVMDKPMINWVLDAATKAGIAESVVIVGRSGEDVTKLLGDEATCVTQAERLGTAHAVMQAVPKLEERSLGSCLVLAGDCPLITAKTLTAAYDTHKAGGCAATVITAEVEQPTGYGRIIRDGGKIKRIVEEKDTDDAEKRINEINSSAYWFETKALLEALPNVKNDNAKGEYYLTDVIELMLKSGLEVGAHKVESSYEILGANTQQQLLALQKIAMEKTLDAHMSSGVMVSDDTGVAIGPDVVIEPGAIIHKGVRLVGNTFIGAGAEIGPDCLVQNGVIGANTRLNQSQVYDSEIGEGARVGPYVHIRPGCRLADGVKIGNFVELKNSTVGEKTSAAHLTYIGDSDIGAKCNIGCGVVTVNYDGSKKHRTVVEDGVFVGCNVNLVAPITIGEGAYLAAGSTVTEQVPKRALAIARARQTNKENWKPKWERK